MTQGKRLNLAKCCPFISGAMIRYANWLCVNSILRVLFAKMVLLFTVGVAYAQFAPPSGGCPPGMHLEGFSCVYDRAPPPRPGPRQPPEFVTERWINSYAAIAVAPGVKGTWATWGQRSYDDARFAVYEACKSKGHKGCQVEVVFSNGITSVYQTADSSVRIGKVAQTEREATRNLMAACKKENIKCSVSEIVRSKRWLEFNGERVNFFSGSSAPSDR